MKCREAFSILNQLLNHIVTEHLGGLFQFCSTAYVKDCVEILIVFMSLLILAIVVTISRAVLWSCNRQASMAF